MDPAEEGCGVANHQVRKVLSKVEANERVVSKSCDILLLVNWTLERDSSSSENSLTMVSGPLSSVTARLSIKLLSHSLSLSPSLTHYVHYFCSFPSSAMKVAMSSSIRGSWGYGLVYAYSYSLV